MDYFINNFVTPTTISQFLNLIILLTLLYKFFKWCFSDNSSSNKSNSKKNNDDDDDFIDYMD